jgi:hypothetical protein
MPRITYSRTSPYANTPQTSWFLAKYKHRAIPRDSEDIPIVLDSRHNYRPDKLSQELYGTPALWWVFMVRNIDLIRDPINDFTTGILIFAPSMGHLKKVLGI